MAEPLKTFFSKALVRRLARDIASVHPAFPARACTTDACRGLDALELLDRGRHIADALGAHLPPTYPDAIEVLVRSLGPEHASDELIGVGMAPFFYLPHTLFVAERGLEYFDLSMRAQYELTKRFSAESSIRPFGYGHEPRVSIEDVTFRPRRVRIGGRVAMAFVLRNTTTHQQQLLVDVAVHFVKACGVGVPKVFELGRIALGSRERVHLNTSFSLAVHTTRVPQPGSHAVDVIVNGRAIGAGTFDVIQGKADAG